MSDRKIILGTTLKAIADAIRNKLGTSKLYKPSEMAEAIESISTGTDVSDTTATAEDVVLDKIFHLADGSQASGLLAENEIFANWSGKDLNHGVTEGYSRGSKTAITSLTELSSSNSSPAPISIGGRYYAKTNGYAISSYSSASKTPTTSGASFSSGWNYMTNSGYAYSNQPSGSPTLLWTNSSPNAVFAAQTVSLDLSSYCYVIVKFRGGQNNTTRFGYGIGFVGGSYTAGSPCMNGTRTNVYPTRNFTVNTSGVVFSKTNAGYDSSASAFVTSGFNGYAIPIAIWGVKGTFTDYTI